MANIPTPAPGSLEEEALKTLLDIARNAASPDAAQAQALLMRRLALEGDVVGSRIPAPRNISEVGGYINLLSDLNQTEMRAQMLAGALGVSGPNPPLGWLPSQPPLSWVTMANDRPAGAWQPMIPLTLTVRSDFANPLQNGIRALHDRGCLLPLYSPPRVLPQAATGPAPSDLLPLLGRTLDIVPLVALHDPDDDPIAMARQAADPFQPVARVLASGSASVLPAPWDGLQCGAATCTVVPAPAGGRRYVALGPFLAMAGFYPVAPNHQPASINDLAWSHYRNVTGLLPGVTMLESELTLVYSPSDIAASALVNRLNDLWNGSMFARG